MYNRPRFRVQRSGLKNPRPLVSTGSCLYLVVIPFHSMEYDGYILKSEVGMRKSEVEIGKLNSVLRGLGG